MEAYEVTQVMLSVGTVYHVRRPRQEELLYSVKGVLMSPTPKFHLVEGEGGKELGQLVGNFLKTKYEVQADGKTLATLTFPAVAFKKTLTIGIGDQEYNADGGVFKGVFQCKDKDGGVTLEIPKELSVLHAFAAKVPGSIPLRVRVPSVGGSGRLRSFRCPNSAGFSQPPRTGSWPRRCSGGSGRA